MALAIWLATIETSPRSCSLKYTHRALDRKHADQIARISSGMATWLSALGSPGRAPRLQALAPTGLHHLAPLRRGVGTLLAEIVHVQHLLLLATTPMTPVPTLRVHRPPDSRSRGSPRPSVSGRQADEQDDRVVKLEEVVHRPQRDVVDPSRSRVELTSAEHAAGPELRIWGQLLLRRGAESARSLSRRPRSLAKAEHCAGLSRRVVIVLGRSGHSVRKRSIRGTARAPPKPRGKCRPLAA